MTGPEHYREAERLMRSAGHDDAGGPFYLDDQMPTLAAAQVHATLALAAATAEVEADGRTGYRSRAWSSAIGEPRGPQPPLAVA